MLLRRNIFGVEILLMKQRNNSNKGEEVERSGILLTLLLQPLQRCPDLYLGRCLCSLTCPCYFILYQTSAWDLPNVSGVFFWLNFDGINAPLCPKGKHNPAMIECVNLGLRIERGEPTYSKGDNFQSVVKNPVKKEKASRMDNLKYLLGLSFEQNLVSFIPNHKEY